MAYSVTMAAAIARVQYLADLEGQDARHTGLQSELNIAQREVRDICTALGWPYYRRVTTNQSLTAPSTALPGIATYTASDSFERVLSVFLKVTANGADHIYPLERGTLDGVLTEQAAWLPSTAWLPQTRDAAERPRYLPRWEVQSADGAGEVPGSGATEGVSSIWFTPASAAILAQGSPRVSIAYLPSYTDVSNTSHMLRYPHSAAYTWVVSTVAWRSLALRDGAESRRAVALAAQAKQALDQLQLSVPAAPAAPRLLSVGRADR